MTMPCVIGSFTHPFPWFCLAVDCEEVNWTELTLDHLQRREEHWAIVDLVRKGGHIRTVPVPDGVKHAIDDWLKAARDPIDTGPILHISDLSTVVRHAKEGN